MFYRSLIVVITAFAVCSCKTLEQRSQQVRVPIEGAETMLSASVFYPEGEAPFPVAILNHGTPASASKRARMGKWLKPEPINALVERGFVVMVPMRRGFGATGGRFNASIGGCSDPDFYNASLGAAQDVVAAIRYARGLPSVDPSRILLIGHSAGGIASLAAASLRPEGLVAVVNFSGGRGSGRTGSKPGVPCYPERMRSAIGRYARSIDVPVLWYYAENDTYFGPPVVRDWFESFQSNGGKGRLVIQTPYGSEGHFVLTKPGGSKHWGPVLDRFLVSHGFQMD